MPWRRLSAALLAATLAGCNQGTDSLDPAQLPPPPPRVAGKDAKPPDSLAAGKSAPKIDVEAAMARARHLFESGNLPSATRALDEVVAAEPENRDALRLLVMVTRLHASQIPRPLNSPILLHSAQALRQLKGLKKGELTAEEKQMMPEVFYNEACTLALNGETDRAMAALIDACDAGFVMAGHFDTDPELDGLRKLPAFQKLQRDLEKKSVAVLLANSSTYRFDFRVPDPDGKVFSLEDLKGKLTIVDFWGTWCPPCRKEIPHLVELSKRYKDRGLRVVGLSYEQTGTEEAKKAVKAFVKDHGVTYPCLMGDKAAQALVVNFEGFPTTLFVDANGMVKLRLSGYQSLAALEAAIEALLPSDKEKEASKGKETAAAEVKK